MVSIINYNELVRDEPHRHALEIVTAGLAAADPEKAVEHKLKELTEAGLIPRHNRTRVVAFGKASVSMVLGALKVLGQDLEGYAIVPKEVAQRIPRVGKVEVLPGNHPLPGKETLESSLRVLEYVGSLGEDDHLLTLISGGGSALFEVPYPPLTIDDVAETAEKLMRSGADVRELNTVRKHLSLVKGGRLAEAAYPARVTSLIVSDVVGDDVSFVASGPTVPDQTTYGDAVAVLKARGVWGEVPPSVRELLAKGVEGLVPETPKPGNPVFSKVTNVVVASNAIALKAMAKKARKLRYRVIILSSMVQGEAREIGKFIAGVAGSVARYGFPIGAPAAVLMGGETTVTVVGDGLGGRNQELVVSFALYCPEGVSAVLASVGSDGIDGNSPAAGGIVDCETLSEAGRSGVDLKEALSRNDTYRTLKELRRAIITGYTGTNVNDLIVLLVQT